MKTKIDINGKEIWVAVQRIFWVACLLGAAVLVISAVEQRKTKEVPNVIINIKDLPGGNLITRADVLRGLEREFVYKLNEMPLGKINVERIERELKDEPFIKDAEVYVDAKNQVHISLTQRQPILRVIDGLNKSYYIDKEGKKMPLSVHNVARVVVATGNVPPYTDDFLERKKHPIKDLFEITKHIKQDKFMNALVEQIFIREDREFILVPKIGKQKILLGTNDNIDKKIERLKIFYTKGMPYEGWQKYSYIDLRYKGQVVCKKS